LQLKLNAGAGMRLQYIDSPKEERQENPLKV
jgi:hypothetical protein